MQVTPKVKLELLSSRAREVLGQMFLTGPKWDGYVASKTGRDELVKLGLVERGNGWQWLTRDGVETAIADAEQWGDSFTGNARSKVNTSKG